MQSGYEWENVIDWVHSKISQQPDGFAYNDPPFTVPPHEKKWGVIFSVKASLCNFSTLKWQFWNHCYVKVSCNMLTGLFASATRPSCSFLLHYLTWSCDLWFWNQNLMMHVTTSHKAVILVKPGHIVEKNALWFSLWCLGITELRQSSQRFSKATHRLPAAYCGCCWGAPVLLARVFSGWRVVVGNS